jgi:hypothetical protein
MSLGKIMESLVGSVVVAVVLDQWALQVMEELVEEEMDTKAALQSQDQEHQTQVEVVEVVTKTPKHQELVDRE